MKIVDISSVVIHGESLSNVMRTNSRIHKEQGWGSELVAEAFSTHDYVLTYAVKDYFNVSASDSIREFLSNNKAEWIRKFLPSRLRYKPEAAFNVIENADIRIWHFGSFYPLFQYFHRNDVLFYYGITYPYLSYNPAVAFNSYSMIQTVKSLNPKIITISNFIKKDLVKQGFDPGAFRVLPLFHTYNLKYADRARHKRGKPRLLAYGRYAKNKAVPELARICSESNTELTHFGDNMSIKEFREEYKKAVKYANGIVRILPKQDKIEDFFSDSDIYVCNSYHEGFNLPIIESEAHSLPVLARRGTAMDDLVVDNYNGFLFDSADEIPDLAERIMKDYKRFSRNAWRHSNDFTYEKYKGRYLRILKDIKRQQLAKG